MAGEAPAAAAPAAAPAAPDTSATSSPAPETKPSGDGPPTSPEKAATPDEPWRKIKHKVALEGKEDEVEYDELVKGYQRGKTATKRFEEAAKIKAEVEQLFELARTDKKVLWAIAKELGHDPKDLAAELMLEDAEEAKLSPAERELREVKAERDRLKKEREDREAKAAEEAIERDSAKYVEELKTTISETLKKAGVPPTKKAIAHFVQIANGDPSKANSEAVAAAVREEYEEDLRELLTSGDAGMRLIGEDGLKKLRAADAARVKSPFDPATAPAPPAKEQSGNGRKPKEPSYISLDAFADKLARRG